MSVDDQGQVRLSARVSERDVAVIRALIRRGSAAGASMEMNLSERHTRRLVARILDSLALDNTYALVAWAATHGLVRSTDLNEPEG